MFLACEKQQQACAFLTMVMGVQQKRTRALVEDDERKLAKKMRTDELTLAERRLQMSRRHTSAELAALMGALFDQDVNLAALVMVVWNGLTYGRMGDVGARMFSDIVATFAARGRVSLQAAATPMLATWGMATTVQHMCLQAGPRFQRSTLSQKADAFLLPKHCGPALRCCLRLVHTTPVKMGCQKLVCGGPGCENLTVLCLDATPGYGHQRKYRTGVDAKAQTAGSSVVLSGLPYWAMYSLPVPSVVQADDQASVSERHFTQKLKSLLPPRVWSHVYDHVIGSIQAAKMTRTVSHLLPASCNWLRNVRGGRGCSLVQVRETAELPPAFRAREAGLHK